MAELGVSQKWTLTSTGTGKAINCRNISARVRMYVMTSAGCTAVTQFQHSVGSSSGAYGVLSSIVSTVSDCGSTWHWGPLEWVRPRVTDKTAGGTTNVVTVYLRGN